MEENMNKPQTATINEVTNNDIEKQFKIALQKLMERKNKQG